MIPFVRSKKPRGRAAINVALAVLFLAFSASSQVSDTQILRGSVVDANGDPVAGAELTISRSGNSTVCSTGDDGFFECEIEGAGQLSIVATAQGQRSLEYTFDEAEAFSGPVTIRIDPSVFESISVATPEGFPSQVQGEASSITLITSERVRTTAGTGLDDALRLTPGFTLFRRTTSRTANPTTQGASLRGINPSGASRSLVLVDSVPLNDPFGGWVPWASVAPIGIDEVQVLRGGSSSLYGSDSIGGTVAVTRKQVRDGNVFSAEAFGGSLNTAGASFFTGLERKHFEADLVGSAFNTGGYVPIENRSRGLADESAGSRDLDLSGRLTPKFGADIGLFVRATYFAERRKNGTQIQRNRSNTRKIEAGADTYLSDLFEGTSGSRFSIRAWGVFQVFDQSFSAVADDRDSESLVRLQRVPSRSLGLSVVYQTNVRSHALQGGIELKRSDGWSDEIGFFGGNARSRTGSGGKEFTAGFYFQDRVSLFDRAILTGRIRYDRWKNFGALRSDLRLSDGALTVDRFPDREEDALSPGFSLLLFLTSDVSAYFNASGSFRAPTLNELYRGFRVGSIVTLSNENLTAERAVNYEGGVSYRQDNFRLRAVGFSTTVRDAVSNVTIEPDSSPILRQRQNAARIISRGFELEGDVWSDHFAISAGYSLIEAFFSEFPANPFLEGLRIPQTPRHNLTFRFLVGNAERSSFGVQAKASSGAFDDDQNEFRMGSYLQTDLFGSWKFGEEVSVFGTVENVFNSRYTVGLTPLRTVGSPFSMRVGFRFR
ncbi:MAG: TonB-dependent receptor [Acidobacteria bacterium]|nr:MAG: TonB-dependent receptor [Acidobacteriota bacterium]REK03074.1 MAG: TonB-dependent receptor [Acidobacteriota bacterium]REK13122.1 MAG: TonB-dependent receptor [Acidobacteriota bacterium]REK41116.1 MAG: TonB-dependent receptor [Acidobacteriota bacterium]